MEAKVTFNAMSGEENFSFTRQNQEETIQRLQIKRNKNLIKNHTE